jgi:hypothetical protein
MRRLRGRWRSTTISVVAAVSIAGLGTACGSGTSAGGGVSVPASGQGSPAETTGAPASSGTQASPAQNAVAPQSPVPAESNPPGDIPDNTVFVPYTSRSGGFAIEVPEGWARSSTGSGVRFTSTLNGIAVSWSPAVSAPTTTSARSLDVPALQRSEAAFRLQDIRAVALPTGPAVLITYQENSAPNRVTGKQYRLVVERFELFKNGMEAVLTLSSPVGADNVDPWRIVSESFRWA